MSNLSEKIDDILVKLWTVPVGTQGSNITEAIKMLQEIKNDVETK